MGDLVRFGRRVPLPSTVQILHDLLVMARNDNASQPNGAQAFKAKADPEMVVSAATLPSPLITRD